MASRPRLKINHKYPKSGRCYGKIRIEFRVGIGVIESALSVLLAGYYLNSDGTFCGQDDLDSRASVDALVRAMVITHGESVCDTGLVTRKVDSPWKADAIRSKVRQIIVDLYPEFHAEIALEALNDSAAASR